MKKTIKRKISALITFAMVFSFGALNVLDAYDAVNEGEALVKLNYDYIEELPDGGKIYIYHIGGQKHKFPVPPEGFSPLTATDEQLSTYGFPPRPDSDNTEDYEDWVEIMSCYKSASAPEIELVITGNEYEDNGISTQNDKRSPDGAGYVSSLLGTGNFYSQVQGDFIQPTIFDKDTLGSCANTFMVGFGALQGTSSAAAGTLCYGKEQAYAYYECYNTKYATKDYFRDTSVPVNPGDKVHVYVSYQKANNAFNYYIVNLTTQKQSVDVVEYKDSNFFSGEYASWFASRPKTFTGSMYNLGQFSNVQFSNCKAMVNTSSSWTKLANLKNVSKISMAFNYDTNIMAYPGSISDNGEQFSCRWKSSY